MAGRPRLRARRKREAREARRNARLDYRDHYKQTLTVGTKTYTVTSGPLPMQSSSMYRFNEPYTTVEVTTADGGNVGSTMIYTADANTSAVLEAARKIIMAGRPRGARRNASAAWKEHHKEAIFAHSRRSEHILGFEGIPAGDRDLSGLNLRDADLREADLEGADLEGADLEMANLYMADLEGANLQGADLHGTDLKYAKLRGADLRYAYLYEADLRYANLHGANLSGANLPGANLIGANLYEANLGGANLGGADLRGADLGGVEGLTSAQKADYKSRGAII